MEFRKANHNTNTKIAEEIVSEPSPLVGHNITMNLKNNTEPNEDLLYSVFDVYPPLSENLQQKSCFSKWFSFVSDPPTNSLIYTRTFFQGVSTKKMVWATITTSGPNITSTDCDGIPRIRFINETITGHSLVTVTQLYDTSIYAEVWPSGVPNPLPTCSGVPLLDPYYCRQLWGMDEIGGALAGKKMVVPYELKDICPVIMDCSPKMLEVVLIYWPEDVITRDICGLNGEGSSVTKPWDTSLRGSIFKTTAITFKGQDLYLQELNGKPYDDGKLLELDEFGMARKVFPYLTSSVLTGDFTFTSPTVYLAHRPIYRIMNARTVDNAVDGWQWMTQLPGWDASRKEVIYQQLFRNASIIALNSTDIFTLKSLSYNISGTDYAKLVAKGSLFRTMTRDFFGTAFTTAPIRIGDLVNPVPASLYYDARFEDCWGNQTHCGTITDDTYRPTLRLPAEVWKSIFGGKWCGDPLLADPAISIHPIDKRLFTQESFPDTEPASTAATPTIYPIEHSNPAIESAKPINRPTPPVPQVTYGPNRPQNTGLIPSSQNWDPEYGQTSSGLRDGNRWNPFIEPLAALLGLNKGKPDTEISVIDPLRLWFWGKQPNQLFGAPSPDDRGKDKVGTDGYQSHGDGISGSRGLGSGERFNTPNGSPNVQDGTGFCGEANSGRCGGDRNSQTNTHQGALYKGGSRKGVIPSNELWGFYLTLLGLFM
jgi:hypothetical protein